MTDKQIEEYTRRINMANRSEMVVIVYDIAMDYIVNSLYELKYGSRQSFISEANKARKCISDLIDSLDFEYEISLRLLELYTYINKELLKVKIDGKREHLDNCANIISKLKAVFSVVAQQDSSPAMMQVTRHVEVGMTYGRGTLNENVVDPQGSHSFSV